MALTEYSKNLLRMTNEAETGLNEFVKTEGQNFSGYVSEIIRSLAIMRIIMADWNTLWQDAYNAIRKEIDDPAESDERLIKTLENMRTRDQRLYATGLDLSIKIHKDPAAEDFLRIAKPKTYELLQGIIFEVVILTTEEGRAIREEKERYVQAKKKLITAELEAVKKIESRETRYAKLREKLEKKYGNRLDKLIKEYKDEMVHKIKTGEYKAAQPGAQNKTEFVNRAA